MEGDRIENTGIIFAVLALLLYGWFCLAQLVDGEFLIWFIGATLFSVISKIAWKKYTNGDECAKAPRICFTACGAICGIVYSFKCIVHGSHKWAFWCGTLFTVIAMTLIIIGNDMKNKNNET